ATRRTHPRRCQEAPRGGVPGLYRRKGSRSVGRPDRRDAGRGAGDRAGSSIARLLPRHRLLRTRLRHRSGGGAAHGGHHHRRSAAHRPEATEVRALQRRVALSHQLKQQEQIHMRLKHSLLCLSLAFGLVLAAEAPSLAQNLPPVPETIKKQGLLRVGVKCDYPPDGYLDAQGKPQGVEVSLAKQIAAYAFGGADKFEFTCVTAANRIPSLQGGKIDLLLATLGVSAERAQVIDFSDNYAWGGSDVLVPKDSPIKSLTDFAGKNVIVMKGAWQIGWFEKNVPSANLLKLD